MTHISGFDYGTSNCALGIMKNGHAELQVLENGQYFMPSTLYSLHRDMIPEWLSHNILADTQQRHDYKQSRQGALQQAARFRREEGIQPDEDSIFFGQAAFEEYLAMPDEGYFVKSPKSFLGSSGLPANAIGFFEDIITAMMVHIKQQAEHNTQSNISHTVIGRPVNFQGIDSHASNQQAQTILTTAAKRAGFSECEFLYEPLAAGLHFEQNLSKDNTVLVVDIGGGTTDCSMVRMGPSHIHKALREDDFLAHSGERVGGNDLDIALSAYQLMPLFGMHSLKKNNLSMPTQLYWDAVSTNDLSAQTVFYSQATEIMIEQLTRDAHSPNLLKRLTKMRAEKQNHHIVRSAEQGKISLSHEKHINIDLNYIESKLGHDISRQDLDNAIQRPLDKMLNLMQEVITQAGYKPDLIFLTGGSAKSPVITQAIENKIGHIKIIDGDHFGSVASGLTLWANKIYA
jgi:hypothetical chaperone protein